MTVLFRYRRTRFVRLSFFLALLALLPLAGCGGNQAKGPLKIGDPAPDFTLTALAGEVISLHNWRGHPVIMRFWSTDCVYCRADTPIFNKFYEKYKDRGLRVVYVNSGASQEDVARFVNELAIPFPVVMDENGRVAALYRVKIVPQTIFIDPDQRIDAAVPGGINEEELQKLLGKYLS